MSTPDRDIAQIVGEACGAVSLCWEPRPTGVFDSTTAASFVDEAVADLAPLLAEARREGAEQGWDEGRQAGLLIADSGLPASRRHMAGDKNPYRADKITQGER